MDISNSLPSTSRFWHLYRKRATISQIPQEYKLDSIAEQRMLNLAHAVASGSPVETNSPIAADIAEVGYPAHVTLRNGAKYLGEGFGIGLTLTANVEEAVRGAMNMWAARQQTSFGPSAYLTEIVVSMMHTSIQTGWHPEPECPSLMRDLGIELTIFYGAFPIADPSTVSGRAQFELGLHGLAIEGGGFVSVFSSLKSIRHNYRRQRVLERLSESAGLRGEAYMDENVKLYGFAANQLLRDSRSPNGIRLYRGDRLISSSAVTKELVEESLSLMGAWLQRMVGADGRLEYSYHPSRGEFSRANNMIRQWMSTHAIAELANYFQESSYVDIWNANVKFNIEEYCVRQGDFAYILYNDKAKLGAAACAVLALLAGAQHDTNRDLVELLSAFIEAMQLSDGSFRTFYIPENRNDNQNFYSGEALLALAHIAKAYECKSLWSKIEAGFDYYMPFFRRTGRNTAFVPWHTMAYWNAYQETAHEKYKQAIFELNDWLICLQNLDEERPPDILGRFYRPEFSRNGPPHASSTAVYVEGLSYAYDLAARESDSARAEAYLRAIRLGLRSLLQLMFRDENSFYLRRKPRCLGGVRTTTSDNRLRCDNTQHAVMALLASLRFLNDEDWERDTTLAGVFHQACLDEYTPLYREYYFGK